MPLPTLDRFIDDYQEHLKKTGWPNANSYVRYDGFSHLYVRIGPRLIENTKYQPVLDLANAEAKVPGSGAFSHLVADLHDRKIHLYAECVINPRMPAKLQRMGFTRVQHSMANNPSYYLLATDHLNT